MLSWDFMEDAHWYILSWCLKLCCKEGHSLQMLDRSVKCLLPGVPGREWGLGMQGVQGLGWEAVWGIPAGESREKSTTAFSRTEFLYFPSLFSPYVSLDFVPLWTKQIQLSQWKFGVCANYKHHCSLFFVPQQLGRYFFWGCLEVQRDHFPCGWCTVCTFDVALRLGKATGRRHSQHLTQHDTWRLVE